MENRADRLMDHVQGCRNSIMIEIVHVGTGGHAEAIRVDDEEGPRSCRRTPTKRTVTDHAIADHRGVAQDNAGRLRSVKS